jgi:hypothetical protein
MTPIRTLPSSLIVRVGIFTVSISFTVTSELWPTFRPRQAAGIQDIVANSGDSVRKNAGLFNLKSALNRYS